jgi:Na+-driven multidrug efflux pump
MQYSLILNYFLVEDEMKELLRRTAIASLIAAVLNTIVFFVAIQISGPLVVTTPSEMELTAIQPFIFTLLLGILGGSAVGFIALRTAQPQRTWIIVSMVALLLYGVPPFVSAGVVTALWFNVMHAVAGIVLIQAVASVLPQHTQK